MKDNVELRGMAWNRLWEGRWFGRLFGGGLLLGICGYAMQVVLGGILRRLGVQSWEDYLKAYLQNLRDVTTPLPNLTDAYIFQATSSLVLLLFFSFLMAGIASYGGAVILRKCLADDERDWLAEAFGGFRDPFGMLWLNVRRRLIAAGWGALAGFSVGLSLSLSLQIFRAFGDSAQVLAVAAASMPLAIGCGCGLVIQCIPFYRYRFLWLVKAEHPDWSAGRCLAACRELMRGNMMRSVRLDCSYWKPITLVLLAMVLVTGCIIMLGFLLREDRSQAALLVLGAFAGTALLVPLCVVVGQYISVGQGLLYEELRNGPKAEN